MQSQRAAMRFTHLSYVTVPAITANLGTSDSSRSQANDTPRGSRGYDEINQAKRPGNYGWPYFVGSNFPYAKFDYATKELGKLFDPQHPVNNSPNNTGAKVLPPAQPAMIYWPYGQSAEFPELGEGGRTACALGEKAPLPRCHLPAKKFV